MTNEWDQQGVLGEIIKRKCKVVALQFPDELLSEATSVTRQMQKLCEKDGLTTQVYLLADTTYNSLSVDEVAAAHVNADLVVHYGRASLTPLSRVPAYFVFGKHELDVPRCAQNIAEYASAPLNPNGILVLLVILDQPLLWALPDLQKAVKSASATSSQAAVRIVFADAAARVLEPDSAAKYKDDSSRCCKSPVACTSESRSSAQAPITESSGEGCNQNRPAVVEADNRNDESAAAGPSGRFHMAGYAWSLPVGVTLKECIWLWVGPEDAPALSQLQMTNHEGEWVMLEPGEGRWQDGLPLHVTKLLRRRYYLLEKAKNATIVGIVVGTLGVAGYLKAANEVRRLAKAAGKKTYTLLMGKPSPAKLANFPEIEVFVLIADPQGQILDSKEFYAPIITPYEAQLAFTDASPADWLSGYRLDFDALLAPPRSSGSPSGQEPRFSLLDGRYHDSSPGGELRAGGESRALVDQGSWQLLADDPSKRHLLEIDSAASYLKARRSYQGLEAPAAGAERKAASPSVPGRSGRAAKYSQEPAEQRPAPEDVQK